MKYKIKGEHSAHRMMPPSKTKNVLIAMDNILLLKIRKK